MHGIFFDTKALQPANMSCTNQNFTKQYRIKNGIIYLNILTLIVIIEKGKLIKINSLRTGYTAGNLR